MQVVSSLHNLFDHLESKAFSSLADAELVHFYRFLLREVIQRGGFPLFGGHLLHRRSGIDLSNNLNRSRLNKLWGGRFLLFTCFITWGG